jgi:16S rRNA (guanine966-N2)-methyltransferase
VRIIGGSARGRVLRGPPRPRAAGRPGIRPTSDLVRGVIFDMLDAMDADYARVLDLYAGTGALAIEALSRGDGTADLVDEDATAVAVMRANLQIAGMEGRATVHRMDAARVTSRLSGPYTLVLADPPYYDGDVFAVPRTVAGSSLVDRDSVIVVEHHTKVIAPDALGPFALYRSRRHGDTVVSIYAQEDVD